MTEAMQETTKVDGKAKARRVRFAVYAVVLLAAVAALGWLRLETEKVGPPDSVAVSAEMKARQQALSAERQRNSAAYALVRKAIDSQDPAEQTRLYDEIISRYKDDRTTLIRSYVAWALYEKSLLVTDPAEKDRLLDELVTEYGAMTDRKTRSYVAAALTGRIRWIGSVVEKSDFCDGFLEKYGEGLSEGLTALLMREKAEATGDPAEKATAYEAILDRFLTSADDGAFDTAINAAMKKMELSKDKNEQLRLCDIVIEAYLKTPNRTQYYLFDNALEKKAELVDDPALPLRMYDQIIANNAIEESVVLARSSRLRHLKDDKERLAACDELIAAHQASTSDYMQYMVAGAMARKAELLTDREAKMAQWQAVKDKSAGIKDSRAQGLVRQAVTSLAELSGDTASAVQYFDEEVAKAKNDLEAIRLLERKVGLANSQAEKVRVYDEIIARGKDNSDPQVSKEVDRAMQYKIWQIDDREEEIRLYDALIARGGEPSDAIERADIAEYMLNKARLLDDKAAQISLYDEIIAKGQNSGHKEDMESIAEAMFEKAELLDDREEKIKLYDTVLFEIIPAQGSFSALLPGRALQERAKLIDQSAEKLALYDRFIAAVGASLEPQDRMSFLLDKTDYMSEPADKLRLYDEVIAYGEGALKTEASGSGTDFSKKFQKGSIMNKIAQAVLDKAELLQTAEDKLRLYDWYLALPQTDMPGLLNIFAEMILAKKAELSGDRSVLTGYYDAQLQTAANDSERADWYERKARALKGAEQAAVDEEIIAKFFDSTERGVDTVVVRALSRKIERAPNAAEKIALCDRLIERYGQSNNDRVMYAVARAYQLKAEATKDDAMKLSLYSTIIERYQHENDYLVKRIVDEAIAAKFRLEAKTAQ